MRLLGDDAVGGRVDDERDVGHQLAIDTGAGQQDRRVPGIFGAALAVLADILPVGMARNHQIDTGGQVVEDRLDLAGQVVQLSGSPSVVLPPWWIRQTPAEREETRT